MSAPPMPMPAPARPPASPTQPGAITTDRTSMTNRTTLAQLREMDVAQAARLPVDHLALLGPSAGCLPDALFARGVTQIGGRWITDPAGAIDAVRAGRGLGEVSRKFAFSRDDWPGCPALLERL